MDLYLIIYNILISSILIGCNNSDLDTCKKDKDILTAESRRIQSIVSSWDKRKEEEENSLLSGWTQLGSDIDGDAVGDESGHSVSLSSDGNRVAIGASGSSPGNNESGPGHVKVYEYKQPSEDEWNTGNAIKGEDTTRDPNKSYWTQLGSDIDGDVAGDYSVSLSSNGNRVAIGAGGGDGNGGTNSGHVKVYEYKQPSEDEWDYGNVIKGEETTRDPNKSYWTQLGSDIDGDAEGDNSGTSVSLSSDGKRVAIGAPYNDDNGKESTGHVRVYEYNDSSWTPLGSDINGEAVRDILGNSVSLSSNGNRVAIGAPQMWNSSKRGHVRVYELNGSSWTKLGSDIDGEAGGDFSGNSVSLSSDGNRVAIGAPFNGKNGKNSGHVTVYEYKQPSVDEWTTGNVIKGDDTTQDTNKSYWTQLGLDIYGDALGDESGHSVSLSSDGNRVAIGAPQSNTDGNGYVKVYEWDDSIETWIAVYVGKAPVRSFAQFGSDGNDGKCTTETINNKLTHSDENLRTEMRYNQTPIENMQSGYSVSLSSDGNRVAIGAPGNESGHVRVYYRFQEISLTLATQTIVNIQRILDE